MTRPRRPHKTDSKRHHDWLEHAGEDVLAANLLMKDDRCYSLAVFHCQQAIEKSLKAYILVNSGQLMDGHNLVWLCKQAAKYDGGFLEWFTDNPMLNRSYIETRYPSDILIEFDYSTVQQFYRMAKRIYLFVCEEMDHAALTVHEFKT